MDNRFDIFLACPPGLEPALRDEALANGFAHPKMVPGGVEVRGGWPYVWRANLVLRGANRVLIRLAEFEARHFSDLEQGARDLPWAQFLSPGTTITVETTCRKSKIYHSDAASERIAKAAIRTGIKVDPEGDIRVSARIEKDKCTISLDTSGELLHRRGFKQAVNRAPLRETLAALFLRQCGFDGTEPVVDPMCGSGTIIIEAAEMAAGLLPGRQRSFAFEWFESHDPDAYADEKDRLIAAYRREAPFPLMLGSDRDTGAIKMSRDNAYRSGVDEHVRFEEMTVSESKPPEGAPGLVLVNPPYGMRISKPAELRGVYRALGQRLTSEFKGWRVGLITSEPALAAATGLKFLPPGPPIPHGPIRIQLYQTEAL
ncbi:class I SAM-dependent RNA methyltransferase [Parvularcula sp. LCG005]|uniref:THUMP domain-containing class I SAM-dependent RNA methyltransferase n=1 Tax=Parvularcula sp. LCG005 TaxID=3078805 RepID=UPI002942F614|nr:hypothetical protein [Parvularcula sp. LCG005]WOI53435.1 hypothetical protein RUI03_00225 [Parvularcula sp. LCG005]